MFSIAFYLYKETLKILTYIELITISFGTLKVSNVPSNVSVLNSYPNSLKLEYFLKNAKQFSSICQMSLPTIYKLFRRCCRIEDIRRVGNRKIEILFRKRRITDVLSVNHLAEDINRLRLRTRFLLPHYKHCPISEPSQQPAYKCAAQQDSSHHILNCLNDDCLVEIFNCTDFLEWELREVSKVCKRFNYLAQEVYRNRQRNDPVMEFLTDQSLWRVESNLRKWGVYKKTIRIELPRHVDIILTLVDKYCPNLQTLECNMYEMSADAEYIGALKRIEKLCIKPAEVMRIRKPLTLPVVHLPNLKSVELVNADIFFLDGSELFFQVNPQIVELRLIQVQSEYGIERIVYHLPLLRTLSLKGGFRCTDYTCYGRMHNLKSFTTDMYRDDSCIRILKQFKKRKIPLEQLRLESQFVTDELIAVIVALHSIQRLTFYVCFNVYDKHLMSIIDNMINLKYLFMHSEQLSYDGVLEMLDRPHQLDRADFLINRIPEGRRFPVLSEVVYQRGAETKGAPKKNRK